MANQRKYRVLVLDAEPVSRYGLVQLFNSHERLRVIAEAETMPSARELCERHRPEVVVFDSIVGDGVEFIEQVKRLSPDGRVVIFTSQADAMSVARAFKAGAAGYVTRRDSVAALMSAVFGALDGDQQLAPCVQRELMKEMVGGRLEVRAGAESALSDRELQVYRLLGDGLRARNVATELGLSVKTVETHLQRIKVKLGVTNGGELQRRAFCFREGVKAQG